MDNLPFRTDIQLVSESVAEVFERFSWHVTHHLHLEGTDAVAVLVC